MFREHYSDLQYVIQSPDVLAGVLYTRGIVHEDVRDRAQSPFINCVKKSQILLNAVEQAIKAQPENFFLFLDILKEEPTTEPFYKRLRDTYGQCIVHASRYVTLT